MKKVLISLICLVFFMGLSGSASATTPISGCTTIGSPGVYVLTGDILNSGASTCISITSSDVIFDGQGYTIDGVDTSNTYGVYVYTSTAALTNVTVKNLEVTDWSSGIYYRNTQNGRIENNTANSNNIYGIYLFASGDNLIYNNYFNNTVNFYVDGTIYSNDWNITKSTWPNIIGGPYLGGNFWATPSGNGFSETCTDADGDGICDSSYTLASGNIDFLPLTAMCVAPPSGLVSWWPGDGNANDIQDGNHGTLMNGATFAAGKVGQALSFDGVDDYVEVPDSPNLRISDSITVDAWFKTGTAAGWPTIVSKFKWISPTEREGYWLGLSPANRPVFYIEGITSSIWCTGTSPVADNKWHHIAGTLNGTDMRVYLDGKLELNCTGDKIITGTTPLSIGNDIDNEIFTGLIDEVEIFNRALTAAEVQSIYNASSAGKCTNDPSVAIGDFKDVVSNLSDAVFKNNSAQRRKEFLDKLDEVQDLVDAGEYQEAIDKLDKDIWAKMDGSLGGNPQNDWITGRGTQYVMGLKHDTAKSAINNIR